MDMSSVNSDIIRGNVTIIILNTLVKNGGYGYDILKQIETNTFGVYKLKSATVYNKLNRLEEDGLVSSTLGDSNDTSGATRRYYKLTDKGREFLESEIQKYEFSRTILDNLVSSDEFNLNNDTPPFDPNELRPYSKKEKSEKPKVIYKDRIVEKIVEVEKPIYIEKEVIKPVIQEKIIEVEKPVIQERIIEVEKPVIQEKIVEVEKPVYVERKQLTIEDLDVPEDSSPAITLKELSERLKAQTEKKPEKQQKIKPRTQLDNLKMHGDKTAKYGYERDDQNYKNFYQKLSEQEIEIDEAEEEKETFHSDIKIELYSNGFKLRPYDRKNSAEFYDLNFLFVNRIKRDLSFIFFFIVAVEIAIYWASLYKTVSYVYFMPVSILSLLLALSPILGYFANPNKRVRDRYNFKLSLLLRTIISLNFIGVAIIIAFFVKQIDIMTNKYHLIASIIIPTTLFLNLPLSAFINLGLIKSKRYHTV